MQNIEDAFASHVSNEEFVRAVYLAVFGREADETGLRNYTEALNTGRISRSTVLADTSQSQEMWLSSAKRIFAKTALPDLTLAAPDRYVRVEKRTGETLPWCFPHRRTNGSTGWKAALSRMVFMRR